MPRESRTRAADRTTIRRAVKADADALAALGVRTYREHFTAIWEPAALEAWLREQFDPARIATELSADFVRYDLLLQDSLPIGFSKLLRDRPTPLAAEPRGCELQKIYLLRQHAGHGFGSKLLDHALGVAREWQQPFAWLGVLHSNSGAKRLYERFGFETIGEVALPAAVPDTGMYVMRREL